MTSAEKLLLDFLRGGNGVLPSFEIRQFRTFSNLRMERVNLIVGRNNVGKSMLLEALRLYAGGGHFQALRYLLADRDEVTPALETGGEAFLRVESLFHRNTTGERKAIELGPVSDSKAT